MQAQHAVADPRINHERLFKLVQHFDAGLGIGIEQANQPKHPGVHHRQALLVGLLVVTVIFKASYITMQGARGVPSHFNRASDWESMAASLMAAGAYILVGTSAWIGSVAG